MLSFSWLRNRTSIRSPRGRAQRRPAAPGFRPQLEVLEGRDVPSTLTVTSAADSGPGSLRAEITAANNKDTIVFAPSLNGQTITLTSGELDITKNLTIQGPGAGQLAISGNRQLVLGGPGYYGFRVFEVDSATVTIAGLTITDGYANVNASPTSGGGGGILNHGGKLTVNNCSLTNNYADFGGGIVNGWAGTLTVSGCTLTRNQFTATANQMGGGAIFNYYGSAATVSNSTISGNSGPANTGQTYGANSYGDGGGIYNGGSMTLSGTTVTDNNAYAYGGGIYEDTYASLSILQKSDVSGNSIEGDLWLAYGASPVKISKDSYVGSIG